MWTSRLFVLGVALLCEACGNGSIEVEHPYYLHYMDGLHEVALIRCPDIERSGCAFGILPDITVRAAGVDDRYVVAQTDRGYYYFARSSQELLGADANREHVIGPMNDSEFVAATGRLKLPQLTIRP